MAANRASKLESLSQELINNCSMAGMSRERIIRQLERDKFNSEKMWFWRFVTLCNSWEVISPNKKQ